MQDPDCPGSPDEGYYLETKDPQDEAEWQTKEDTELAEWCGVEPETETVGESQEEEAEPPKKKRPRTLRIQKLVTYSIYVQYDVYSTFVNEKKFTCEYWRTVMRTINISFTCSNTF